METNRTKVLLVEDVKIAQTGAVMALSELNCDVDVAETGTKALKLAGQNRYELILMDLGLPDVDGMTLTETIRKMPEHQRGTPIIALTAHADTNYRNDCYEIGMDGYVVKPLTMDTARDLLTRYVTNKKR